MNIEPIPEVLKIGEKKYRVYKLDEKHYKKQTNEKLPKSMLSYSQGGWKNMEDVPVCAQNIEEREKERQQILQKQQEMIKEYTKDQKQEKIEKSRFTHFIGIPLNTPLLISQINQIQEDLNVDFIDPRKAHLTLCVLRLHDQQIIEKTVKTLKNLQKKIKQLVESYDNYSKLHLKSMGYFGKSEQEARVLFIDLQENKGTELITEIVDLVIKTFIDKQIITDDDLSHVIYNKQTRQYEVEKMHITLKKVTNQNQPCFDVSNILEQYQDFEIKNFIFNSIDLSAMNGKYQENGYYDSQFSYNFLK